MWFITCAPGLPAVGCQEDRLKPLPLFSRSVLIHRCGRDFEKCEEKYGEDWKRYLKVVKYKVRPLCCWSSLSAHLARSTLTTLVTPSLAVHPRRLLDRRRMRAPT